MGDTDVDGGVGEFAVAPYVEDVAKQARCSAETEREVVEGGSPSVEVVLGNPCDSEPTRCAFDEEISVDLWTGKRRLEIR